MQPRPSSFRFSPGKCYSYPKATQYYPAGISGKIGPDPVYLNVNAYDDFSASVAHGADACIRPLRMAGAAHRVGTDMPLTAGTPAQGRLLARLAAGLSSAQAEPGSGSTGLSRRDTVVLALVIFIAALAARVLFSPCR